MNGVWMMIAIKAFAGGCAVILFSLVSEVLKPKEFAGLFSAVPSVATASLLVAMLQKGHRSVEMHAMGMIVGGVGIVLYCLVGTYLVRHLRAKLGSLAAAPVWFATAIGGYALFLR